jgi:catechol 2,3-dioxygenase-like lactoylglutathione lyase family enzyme
MSRAIEGLISDYETGRLSRRDLVLTLAALAAAPLPAAAQAPALRPRTLNHVSLVVSDLERSVAFYQRVFGLPMKSKQTGGVNLAVGDQFLGIYQVGGNGAAQINHFCFGFDSFDPQRTVSALGASGVKGESRVRDGVPQVYCTDPDNLRVQLQDVSFCGGVGALGNDCR